MNSLKILYAEDDIDVLQDTMFLLGPQFPFIKAVQDGKKALEYYYKEKPDIILLDINLPLMSGLEVAKKIRETDDETFIIIISAYSDKEKLLSAINLNVSAYIVKPFAIDEVKKTINKLIEKSFQKFEMILDNNFRWNKKSGNLFHNNNKIVLTKKEIELMSVLYNNPQKVFTVEELTDELFKNTSQNTSTNNTIQLISRFKKKVTNISEIDDFFIENIYGLGYKLKVLN